MPNLTDELSTAKEQHLNQFGLSVLVRCSKSVWCGKSLTESVELMMMNFVHVSMYLADANWGQHRDKINNEQYDKQEIRNKKLLKKKAML